MLRDHLFRAARAVLAACAAVLALGSAAHAVAQPRLSDDAARTASPLGQALDRLDEALRQRVASRDDAASHWIAGEFETLDLLARVRDFGAAAAREPAEPLFAASLARACVPRTVPTLPECASRDAVASVALRDADNAVPWILLAERARQRRQPVADVVANLERASKAPRYDDAVGRSAPLYAAAIRALPGGSDPAVASVAAAGYVERAAGGLGPSLAALCGPKREVAVEAATKACLRVAALMIERAPNLADQAQGAAIASALAVSDSGRAVAEAKSREIAARRQRCDEAFGLLARIAADPRHPGRPRAEAAAAAWPADRARDGETAACERLAAGIATTR